MGRGSGDIEKASLDSILSNIPRKASSSHRTKASKDEFGWETFEITDRDTGTPLSINGAPTMWIMDGAEAIRQEWRNEDGLLHREEDFPAVFSKDQETGEVVSEWWKNGSRVASPYGYNTVIVPAEHAGEKRDWTTLQNRRDDFEESGLWGIHDEEPPEVVLGHLDKGMGCLVSKFMSGKRRKRRNQIPTIAYGPFRHEERFKKSFVVVTKRGPIEHVCPA